MTVKVMVDPVGSIVHHSGGKQAKLIINEAKSYAGTVVEKKFTVFGLGRSGIKTFEKAKAEAIRAIRQQVRDVDTADALIAQLKANNAQIRLIGDAAKNTVFEPAILRKIARQTGLELMDYLHI